jgi:hypothetical protein
MIKCPLKRPSKCPLKRPSSLSLPLLAHFTLPPHVPDTPRKSALYPKAVSIVIHRLAGFSSHMLLPLRDGEAHSRQWSISLLDLTGGLERRRRRDSGIAMVGLCNDRQMTVLTYPQDVKVQTHCRRILNPCFVRTAFQNPR